MKLSQVLSSINQIEKSKCISCLVLLLYLTPLDTTAAILSIEAQGKADFIDPVLAPFTNSGDALAISFELNTDIADSAASHDGFGWYEFNQSLQFSIGSATGTAQGYTGSVTDGPYDYFDDDEQQQCICWDVWTVESKAESGSHFDFVNFGQYSLDIVQLEFRDEQADAISTDELIDGLNAISQFERGWIALYFKDTNQSNSQRYSIRSEFPTVSVAQAIPVNEPISISVLAGGLLLMTRTRKKLL